MHLPKKEEHAGVKTVQPSKAEGAQDEVMQAPAANKTVAHFTSEEGGGEVDTQKMTVQDRLIYQGDYSASSVEEYLQEHKDLIPKSKARAIRRAKGKKAIELIRDLFILRWKPADVKRGWVKMIDGKKKCLKDAVMDKTRMKIDLLGKVGNQFVEVSEIYSIKNKDGTNVVEKSKDEICEEYEDEIRFYSSTNAFKALKRLFSALKLDGEKENLPAMEKLVEAGLVRTIGIGLIVSALV